MANINKNKSENDLKRVIAEVAKEEIDKNTKKPNEKSVKKSTNKSIKKAVKRVTKKDTKKITKKEGKNDSDLIKPIVSGGKSRKKKENLDEVFVENTKTMVEDEKINNINEVKKDDLVVNKENGLGNDDNIENEKIEKNEVGNDENNNLFVEDLNDKVISNSIDVDVDEIFKDDDKIEKVEKKKN